jgi:hypothetical protein
MMKSRLFALSAWSLIGIIFGLTLINLGMNFARQGIIGSDVYYTGQAHLFAIPGALIVSR